MSNTYKGNISKALLFHQVRQEIIIKPSDRGTDITKTIQGRFTIPSQYHYTMETQSCTVSNNSRGVTVRAATQWMDLVNVAVGNALGIEHNRVEVIVPRLGGGYGGKGSRSSQIACACAVVAYKLNRTATLVMSIVDNMAAVGKRQECEMDYEIGINNDGLIQYLNITYYSDCGYCFNDAAGDFSEMMVTLYDTSRWQIEGYSVLTDKAGMTWCRAPGSTESISIIEHIMERIAFATKKDPTDIRLMHLAKKNVVMKDIVASFQRDCDFEERKAAIKKFNEENAWKKKALRLSLMAYPIIYSWNFPVTITIHHADGTISMAHGGIEMGQGINTKVAQVCAYTLKIPLEKVTVRPSDSFTSPNSMASNGSITSDCVAFATVKACEELLRRLEPFKKGLENPKYIPTSVLHDVPFRQPARLHRVRSVRRRGRAGRADGQPSAAESGCSALNYTLQDYTVYGVCAAEVELHVLMGSNQLRRVDLLEDTGISISPDIDVGQHLVYGSNGKLLTNRTWTYKPPGAKDIPADFRVSFRRNSPNPAGVLRSKGTYSYHYLLMFISLCSLKALET
ncbi:Aldehyde oxidase 2 [Operophtera brumata]|uniref:Aldehyde oxidase 2 n=1 Tax=Operophtera brumata TaxID=104452 RepID=A0A0L7K4J2_OPEBR|nr:Aldehyde oxidase 2 [Operophtera brumata]